MRRLILYPIVFILAVFVLPALIHLAVWSFKERPNGWRQANWASAGILPHPPASDTASIRILAARTGGLKGAFATHSWIVIKRPGAADYDRYDVVGWGRPVRKNAYDADGRWYSNDPQVHFKLEGEQAADLIPQVEAAIANYRWSGFGDYTIWPGPNSNTFVASIVRAVPALGATVPSTAVGRDFPADGNWTGTSTNDAWRFSLGGYAGFVFSTKVGIEINFLGLVAGLNLLKGEIKIPAFGTYRW